ncbi:MAG: ATP-binding protein [Bacteroidetes bacterium]|nr:ATP-binding protein [Bacteroidota bacterium]
MIFRRFSIVVLTRIAFLCATVFLLIYLLTETAFVATPFIVALLIIAQVYSLIHYVQKTNRDIARFFDSIKYADFSQSFRSSIKGSSFEELNKAFSDVIDEFRKARAEKEEQYRYLQIVVQHVGIGLIVFTGDGNVELVNPASKKLLRINALQNISDLAAISGRLVDSLRQINAGENVLVKYVNDNELFQLSIYATEFKMRDTQYKFVSLTNIQNELEEREMEAWQNLIRVLTHEIMNSVTPIISLSSTASSLIDFSRMEKANADSRQETGGGKSGVEEISSESVHAVPNPASVFHRDENTNKLEVDLESLKDVKGALDTISRRSNGLLHFVDDYRNLTRIPAPNFQVFRVANLLDGVHKMFAERFQVRGIEYSQAVEPAELELTADPDLIEQVIINLVMNSIGAISGAASPRIGLSAKTDSRGGTLIQVSDNGHGIPEELQEKIFIPFFTTRKEGSGIGLSLSRQIMRAHKGSITVSSISNAETVFTLRF